jgi:hypothetical protein
LFYRLIVMAGLIASVAEAQLGDYLGPSIMSRGAGDIGTRGGQNVDLRFFVNVNGIYDTGLLPLSTGTNGQLVDPGGLAGVEAQVGVYGTHSWRRANIGLDYKGNFRHYNQQSYFDGSDQQLVLGYTYQKSRRLQVEFQGLAGTYSQGFGGVAAQTSAGLASGGISPSTGILFDNRAEFLQGGMDVTYLKSARNSFSAGGLGYDVMRQSKALVGMHGYTLHGAFEHRLSMTSAVGLIYTHFHYDFPRAFGESTADSIQLAYTAAFDRRRWKVKLLGGGMQVEVEGLQTVALDPLVASILGVSTTVQTYYRKTIIPSINGNLTRQFKSSNLTFDYSQGISPGNGVYLTSRQETAGGIFTYNGVRKTSLSVEGNYNSYSSLGQSLTPYRYFGGGGSVSYAVSHALHLTARYDSRHQEIDMSFLKKTSYRMSFGIAFSPGDIPLSIW